MKDYDKPYYIFVSPVAREALQRRAAQEGVTVAALIREAIERYLAKLPPATETLQGDDDINVRLSEEAEAALARHTLAPVAPRHSINAIGRLALADQLGIPWSGEGDLTTVSTRLRQDVVDRLRAAAQAYSREALIRRAIAAYRQQVGK